MLERTLDLSRRLSAFTPNAQHVADPLIDRQDPGMTAAEISALFAELRTRLVPLLRRIAAAGGNDDSAVRRRFPISAQRDFARRVVALMGFDFERGRIDDTAHPFMTTFASDDVRITVRADEHFLGEHLFSAMHEAGHALYELGVDPAFEGTPLGDGASNGMHESQSRLWENFVGRGRDFWEGQYTHLQAIFPEQLGTVPLDDFYPAINYVQPSLIRTDADEVTYNLHVMLRFDLELQLLDGRLAVRDLPGAWRERYAGDLGVEPPDDRDGVLQGRALVPRDHRRRVPGLHAGQSHQRPGVRRGPPRAPRPAREHSPRRPDDASRLAASLDLSPRPGLHRRGARAARHRRPHRRSTPSWTTCRANTARFTA